MSKAPSLTTTCHSRLLTIEEVEAALSASPQDVKKQCAKHNIPVIKVGHKVRMMQEDYDTLLERMKTYYV